MTFCQLRFILLLLLVYFLGGFWLLSSWTEARNLRASLTLICKVAWRKRAWSFYISESLGWRRLYPSLARKYRAPLQGSAHRSLSSSRLAIRWSCLFPSHASVFPDLSAGTSPLPKPKFSSRKWTLQPTPLSVSCENFAEPGVTWDNLNKKIKPEGPKGRALIHSSLITAAEFTTFHKGHHSITPKPLLWGRMLANCLFNPRLAPPFPPFFFLTDFEAKDYCFKISYVILCLHLKISPLPQRHWMWPSFPVAQVFPFQWSGFPSKYCSLGNLSLIVYFSWSHHLLIVNEPPSVFAFFIFHIGATIMSSEGCRRWHHLHCSPCLIGSRALLIAFLQRSQPRPLHPSQPRPFYPISFCCHPAFINYGAKCPLPSLFHAADGSWSSGVVLLRNQWLLWHVQW